MKQNTPESRYKEKRKEKKKNNENEETQDGKQNKRDTAMVAFLQIKIINKKIEKKKL